MSTQALSTLLLDTVAYPRVKGILYKLTCAVTGKSYIGITTCSLQRRLILHKSHAKREKRGALQRAIRKYGFDNFSVEVISTSDNWEHLCAMEIRAIKEFNSIIPNGYNLTAGGEGALGVKRTTEQIKRQIDSLGCRKGILTGRPAGWHHTEEARNKIAEAGRGRIFSEERKAKIGASHLGNKWNLGRECPQKTRDKISAAQKGHPKPKDQIAKMVSTKTGKAWTDARRLAFEKRKSS